MTLIYTIPYPTRFLQNDNSLEEENLTAKEYKDRPISPFENSIDKDEFTGLFAEIEMEGLEEKETEICIYVDEANKAEAEQIIQEICAEQQTTFSISTLENKNWNEQWESNFQPILIDDFVLVRATFHPKNENVQHEIIIEPKMSFGTGHHPTTSQVMQSMRLLNFANKKVLDIGSGTGILAFLAEKLGAASIIAIDNDEWCYNNCIENKVLNKSINVKPEIGDLELVKNSAFDCILANIHRNFLVQNMQQLSALLLNDGYLLVSGFYAEDAHLILNAALAYNLVANYQTEKENWCCIVLQKK